MVEKGGARPGGGGRIDGVLPPIRMEKETRSAEERRKGRRGKRKANTHNKLKAAIEPKGREELAK